MSVKVEGLNKLTRALVQLGVDVDDLKDAMAKIADEGAQVASSLAPRRSGALAGTIRGNRAKAKAVVTAGKARVKYAGPINYGWPARHIRADKFMQQADERMQPRAAELLEQGVQDAIHKAGLD